MLLYNRSGSTFDMGAGFNAVIWDETRLVVLRTDALRCVRNVSFYSDTG